MKWFLKRKLTWKIAIISVVASLPFIFLGFAFGANINGIVIGKAGVTLRSNEQIHITELDLASFKSIDLSIETATIEFRNSDKYGIEISGYEGDINWSLQGGHLKIESEQSKSIMILTLTPGRKRAKTNITIYVPTDMQLEEVSINSSDGNITLDATNAKSIQLISVFANVNLNNVKSESLTIKMTEGTFTGADLNTGILRYQNDFGTGSFERVTAKTFTAESIDGGISIIDCNAEDVTVNSQFGSVFTNMN